MADNSGDPLPSVWSVPILIGAPMTLIASRMRLLAFTLIVSAALPAQGQPAKTHSGRKPAAAVLPDTLEQRIVACASCHAIKERNDAFFPHIAGKPAGYLYNQLINFREGRRQNPMMTYMVDHLPDAYLQEIAEYFSRQRATTLAPQAGVAAPAELERGRVLVTAGDAGRKLPACIACHGEKLGGVAPAVPGLLGLPRDYLNAQFGAWKGKTRHAAAPDCMAGIAAQLTDADIFAISSWLTTQPAAGVRPAASFASPPPLACGSIPDDATPAVAP
jgi:cytochrome c553